MLTKGVTTEVSAAAKRKRALPRGLPRDLLLVFLASFGIRLVWATLIPPWLAPDEPQHFAYIAHIVENGEIPPLVPDLRYPEHSQEYVNSCVLTLCFKLSGMGGRQRMLPFYPPQQDYSEARAYSAAPEQRRTATGSSATDYSALYYGIAAAAYRVLYSAPILARMFAVRSVSAVLSALACVFGYLFAYEVTRARQWGQSVGLLLAFFPMFAFSGASVNNDAAMYAATALLSWLCMRIWGRECTFASAFTAGLCSGVAVLAKQTAAPLVPAALAVVVVRSLRDSGRWRASWAGIVNIGLFGLGCVATEGLWVAYRMFYAVAPVASKAGGRDLLGAILGRSPNSFWAYLRDLWSRPDSYFYWLFVKSFWAAFGWLEIYFSDKVYSALVVLVVVACLGLTFRMARAPTQRGVIVALVGLILYNVAALFFAADFAAGFAHKGSTFGMQGRYFFGAIVPFMFLLASGIGELFENHPLVLRMLPLPMFVLNLASILLMLEFYFGMETP